jgi:putative component of membrane protein insertase Oxa1/YidC/SpoIIIJ protein YidD
LPTLFTLLLRGPSGNAARAALCAAFLAAGPLRAAPSPEALDRENAKRFLATPAFLTVMAYRKGASRARVSFCPMEPSCSTYGLQALQRHGLLWGTLMAADRLHRCGHDLSWYRPVWTPRGVRYLDPVPSDPFLRSRP